MKDFAEALGSGPRQQQKLPGTSLWLHTAKAIKPSTLSDRSQRKELGRYQKL